MQAARERLVLITTPTKVGSYRFDIRQLQEFFAAEYVYVGIKADDLRGRLEVIGGDQHWREVMHFTLSALAEQDRRTELALATAAISEIDRGCADGSQQQLARSLGKGARLVARLAQDGVLDEDKTIRNMFRDLLTPLVSAGDVEDLESLVMATRREECAWLVDFLFEKVEETVEAESQGAATLLWNSIRDGMRWRDRAKSYFGGCSTQMLNGLLSPGIEGNPVWDWQVDCLKERLLKEPVTDSEMDLGRAIGLSFRNRELAVKLLTSAGATCNASHLVAILGHRPFQGGKRINLPGVDMVLEPPAVQSIRRGEALWSRFSGVSEKGVFAVWKAMFRCACLATKESYLELLRLVPLGHWRRLPVRLPLPPDSEDVMADLDRIEEATFRKHVEDWASSPRNCRVRAVHHHPMRRAARLRKRHDVDSEELARLVRDEPLFSLRAWGWAVAPDEGQQALPGLSQGQLLPGLDKLTKQLAYALYATPELYFRLPVWFWQEFLAYIPDAWEKLSHVPSARQFSVNHWLVVRPPKAGDLAVMASDPIYLPRIVSDLTSWCWLVGGSGRHWIRPDGGGHERPRNELRDVFSSMARCLRYDMIRMAQESDEPSVRAAATLVAVVSNQDAWPLLAKACEDLVNLSKEQPSVGPVTAWCVDLCERAHDADARRIVSRLLEVEKSTGRRAQRDWGKVLQRWRELSEEPVAKRGGYILPRPLC